MIPFGEYEMKVKCPPYLWALNTMDPNHVKAVHPGFSAQFQNLSPQDVSLNKTSSQYALSLKKEKVDYFKQFKKHDIRLNYKFVHRLDWKDHLISYTNFGNALSSEELILISSDFGCKIRTQFFYNENLDIPFRIKRAILKANKNLLEEDKRYTEMWATVFQPEIFLKHRNARIVHFIKAVYGL